MTREKFPASKIPIRDARDAVLAAGDRSKTSRSDLDLCRREDVWEKGMLCS